MRTRPLRSVVCLPLIGVVLAACASKGPALAPATAPPGDRTTTAPAIARVIDVYKSPTCDCCHEWEAYLRKHGYTVNSIPTDDLASVKAEHAVPGDAQSCHTALIDGYVVEGHVPVEAIADLLAEAPQIDGIALPGMPPGSPGMPGVKEAPFEVLALADGEATTFGRY